MLESQKPKSGLSNFLHSVLYGFLFGVLTPLMGFGDVTHALLPGLSTEQIFAVDIAIPTFVAGLIGLAYARATKNKL